MGIGHLLDHTARVWRLTEDRGTYGETTRDYAMVYEAMPCFVGRDPNTLAEPGPGITQAGGRMIYTTPSYTFRVRDLVEVYRGSNPGCWEVESWLLPRGHHVQLRCILHQGAVPEVES